MFDKCFIQNVKKLFVFTLIYTLIFIVFSMTISYTYPFILAFTIAVLIKPCTDYLYEKIHLKKGISAILLSAFIFIVMSLVCTFIIFNVKIESKDILNSIDDFNELYNNVGNQMNKLNIFYEKFDPQIVKTVQTQISSNIHNIFEGVLNIINKGIQMLIGVPLLLVVAFVVLFSLYFFDKDMEKMKNKFLSFFCDDGKEKAIKMLTEMNHMMFGYLKAYIILVGITFVCTLIGFWILKIRYTLIISVLVAILDIIPVLGIGFIYIPMVIFYIVKKQYFIGIGIMALFIIITIMIELIEPKVISESVGIHPMTALAIIFIGLASYGVLGMLYLMFYVVLYRIFKKVNII
ncbi:sporulation integral membrane protein YtvI [Tepidibacter hydrothermalis]|uniref:Sporulation integral membrane protein YtvI n=1 Tax=Tepidibacter hydrothermalis TaxID=3036126 RepID=A0ABY8EEH0_9FIRM|nr:sporulation integral membrane protein YtvI [Tepidibacter hydrothermalis]WFD11348.1 sporulation integral membrane protein YtvI [Tepidibacter hydrothermalis]